MTSTTFRWMLAAVSATCVGIALAWALMVPAFQEPDELAHLDYAFALYDADSPFVVRDAVSATLVTREARYLAERARYRLLRYDALAREPVSVMPLRWAIERDTGGPRASNRKPPNGARMPYVMFGYPIAYYAAIAALMSSIDRLTGGSLIEAFIAARLFNVACLIPTLLLACGIFRLAGLDRPTALLATFVVGALPLTSWVAGYVQPDNVSLLLVTASLYAMLRWRDVPVSLARALALAAVLAALFLTKYQYAGAAWLSALILIASRLGSRAIRDNVMRAATIVILLPLAAFVSALSWSPVSRAEGTMKIVHAASAHFADAPIHLLTGSFVEGALDVLDAYFGGTAFEGFWFDFGFRSGALVAGPVHDVLKYLLIALTIGCIATYASLMRRRWIRIARVARHRSSAAAVRLIGSGAALHLYVITTGVLFLARAVTDERLQLLGRYWLPVVVPAVVLILADLSKLIIAPTRRRAAVLSTVLALALACAIASVVDLRAMYLNFYVPSRVAATYASLARVEDVRNDVAARDLAAPIPLDYERPIYARGIAIDGRTGLPAKRVVLVIDGFRRYAATTGMPSPDIAEGFHDDEIANGGFALRLPANVLASGKHRFRFQIEDGPRVPAMRVGRDIDVTQATRRKRNAA